MKAPAVEQLALLDVQAIDTRIGQISHALRTLPQDKSLAELDQELHNARALVASVRGEREDAQIEIDRIESDVQVVRSRIDRDRQRLTTSSSTKDIQGLEHELESLLGRASNLEDIELTVMAKLEDINARLETAAATLATHNTTQATLLAERDVVRDGLRRELKAAEQKRLTVTSGVGAELLALYDRQRERYGIGAALLTRGISGGSHVALDKSALAKIAAASADEVVLCPDSSCILIRTEESGL
jgi:predicted  nucleic acid-binding Zn-ribbon protein